jgi:hypothetical protein
MSGLAPKSKPLTKAQERRRDEVNERTRRMTERGIPFPHKTGGIFGGKATAKK